MTLRTKRHLLVDGSAIGRLDQDFDLGIGQLLHMPRSQRCPPLPRVDVLAADGHDSPVVFAPLLLRHTAPCPLTMVMEKPQHGDTYATEIHMIKQSD